MNPCTFDGCERRRFARGLCQGHAWQVRNGKELTPLRQYRKQDPICSFAECTEVPRSRNLCVGHYDQFKRGVALQPLRTRRSAELDEWYPSGAGYLMKVRDGKVIFQHRKVLEDELGRRLHPHETVHHRNGDRTDNRRSNLELWSSSQPSGQRVEDKVEWAREILALYGGQA